MRKFMILAVTIFSLSACQKETTTEAKPKALTVNANTSRLVTNASTSTSVASSGGDMVIRQDVSGGTIVNGCTGEVLTVLTGTLQLNLAPDGNARSLVITHSTFKSSAGTTYTGMYVTTFEQIGSASQGNYTNTFRFLLHSQDGGTDLWLHGIDHVTINANGDVTVVVDNFTSVCG